jgi:bacterioferritin-associated ferredoxin
MIICICHRISDRDITRAVREGCASFDELQDQTRVATACGACHDCAHQRFHEQAATGRAGGVPAAALATAQVGG